MQCKKIYKDKKKYASLEQRSNEDFSQEEGRKDGRLFTGDINQELIN